MSWPVIRPEDCLPDVDGLEVAVDTETSGRHPDDGARVAMVSVAFDRPDDGEPWCWGFPFDQGNREGKPEWTGQDSLWVDDDPNLDLDAWIHLMRWLRRQRLTMHPVLFDAPMIRAGTRLADYTGDRRWTGPDLIDQCVCDTQVGCKETWPMHPQALKENSVRLELLRGTRYCDQVMGGWVHGIEARDQAINRAHLEKIKVKGGGSAFSTGRWDLGEWDIIGPYGALDALETHLLRKRQLQDLEDGADGSLGPAPLHAGRWLPLERRKTKVLYLMGQRGIGFDTGKCLEAAAQVTKARDELAKELPFKPTIEAARTYWFDPAGPMKLEPYDVTAKGKAKLDQEIVGKMVVAQVPHAKPYQTWTQLNNSLSKWYLAYPSMAGPDGRLRTVFKQTKVRSGRTSVERIQLQAMPNDYQIQERLPPGTATVKQCVSAKPGHQLWALDLAQAELRVAARWAPEPKMHDLIVTGADLHGVTTTELFNVHPGDPDWTMYRQVGKQATFAQPLDEPVLTPSGWCPIGELRPGDKVVGSSGDSVRVVKIPFEGRCAEWEVTLDDGAVIRCSQDHLWTVRSADLRERRKQVHTDQLVGMLERPGRQGHWYLPETPLVQFDPVGLPVDPYLLGVLLGDGSFQAVACWSGLIADSAELAERITPHTPDQLHQKTYAYTPNMSRWSLRGGHTMAGLRALGLGGSPGIPATNGHRKFIPEVYLRGSVEQRYELLRGLMDTDGCVSKSPGRITFFSNSAPRMVEGVVELVRSLGGTARVRWHQPPGNCVPAAMVNIRTPECPFALERKVARWAPPRHFTRRIRSVVPTGREVDQRCISVDAPDGLYLTTGLAVTHNSLIFDAGPAEFQSLLSRKLGLVWELEPCKVITHKWKALYPGFRRAVYRAMGAAQERQYVTLKNGRLSWFNAQDRREDPEMHKAFNRFVQGSLAEMGARWMVWIEEHHPGILVNWVHDASYIEVPNDELWRVQDCADNGARIFEEMFDIVGGVDAHLEAAA